MLKIYSTGCVSCLQVVKKMLLKGMTFSVIDNPEIVIDIASKTLGIVPIFEYKDKYYNQIEISNMVDLGETFEDKPIIKEIPIVKEEVKIINKKYKGD